MRLSAQWVLCRGIDLLGTRSRWFSNSPSMYRCHGLWCGYRKLSFEKSQMRLKPLSAKDENDKCRKMNRKIFLFVPIGPAAIFRYSAKQIGPYIDPLGGPETRQDDLWQTEMISQPSRLIILFLLSEICTVVISDSTQLFS